MPNQILSIDLYLEDQLTAHRVPNQMKENLRTILGKNIDLSMKRLYRPTSFVYKMNNLYTQPSNLKQFRTELNLYLYNSKSLRIEKTKLQINIAHPIASSFETFSGIK